MAGLSDTAHNERVKLTANLLNTIASGMCVTGVIAPVVAAMYGVPGPAQSDARVITAGSILFFLASLGIHLYGRAMLKRLR